MINPSIVEKSCAGFHLPRWYDSTTGRWITEDPSGLGPDSNPYRYCGNDPTNEVDPSGLEAGGRITVFQFKPPNKQFAIDVSQVTELEYNLSELGNPPDIRIEYSGDVTANDPQNSHSFTARIDGRVAGTNGPLTIWGAKANILGPMQVVKDSVSTQAQQPPAVTLEKGKDYEVRIQLLERPNANAVQNAEYLTASMPNVRTIAERKIILKVR